MKISLCCLLLLLSSGLLAAQNTEPVYDYGARKYDLNPCGGCIMLKPGDKAPASHPYAKYINDTTLWEWKEGPYPGSKVYDLKPQYTDTLTRNDGSVISVPIWIKNPNWVKPEQNI